MSADAKVVHRGYCRICCQMVTLTRVTYWSALRGKIGLCSRCKNQVTVSEEVR